MWVKGRSLPGSPLNCTADNSKSSRDSGARRPSAKGLELSYLSPEIATEAKIRGPEMLHAPGPLQAQRLNSTWGLWNINRAHGILRECSKRLMGEWFAY